MELDIIAHSSDLHGSQVHAQQVEAAGFGAIWWRVGGSSSVFGTADMHCSDKYAPAREDLPLTGDLPNPLEVGLFAYDD
jgi:hypothetical protein